MASRVFELEGGAFRVASTSALPIDAARRAAIQKRQQDGLWQPDFVLQVVGGKSGVCSRTGVGLLLGLRFGFSLDPTAPQSMRGWHAN